MTITIPEQLTYYYGDTPWLARSGSGSVRSTVPAHSFRAALRFLLDPLPVPHSVLPHANPTSCISTRRLSTARFSAATGPFSGDPSMVSIRVTFLTSCPSISGDMPPA